MHTNVAGSPTKYGYPGETVFAKYFLFGINFFIFAYIPFYVGGPNSRVGSFFAFPLFAQIILASCPIMASALVVSTFLLTRPVSVDATCVTAYIGRFPFKRIYWRDITIVEKRRSFDDLRSRHKTNYVVCSRTGTIRFQEDLCNLRKFLDAMNENIRVHDIRVVFIDRGLDSRRSAFAKISDQKLRRNIASRGIRTELSEL